MKDTLQIKTTMRYQLDTIVINAGNYTVVINLVMNNGKEQREGQILQARLLGNFTRKLTLYTSQKAGEELHSEETRCMPSKEGLLAFLRDVIPWK